MRLALNSELEIPNKDATVTTIAIIQTAIHRFFTRPIGAGRGRNGKLNVRGEPSDVSGFVLGQQGDPQSGLLMLLEGSYWL